jgi:hypothetical protein
MRAQFIRGQDPKKSMQIGMVLPYPQMTPEAFKNWFLKEIMPYIEADGLNAIHDNIVNNTWEKDRVVSRFLYDRIKDYGIVDELLYMREYFNDNNYIKMLPGPSQD